MNDTTEIQTTVDSSQPETGVLAQKSPEPKIHIALSAERIGEFAGIPITNTLITSWAVIFILFIVAFFVGRNLKMIPGRIQTLFEESLSFTLDYMSEVLEDDKLARKLFPLIVTLFLFIFTANLLEFTPGIGSFGFLEGTKFVPLLRSVNTDLNVTLALAIIAFVAIEIVGVATLGAVRYAGKFLNFSSPINFLVGIIEFFSEIARLISFSFRLFGNILAGEVLIIVIVSFFPYVAPVPMMLFEIFVGFIQAAIFALLTLFFVKIAITHSH